MGVRLEVLRQSVAGERRVFWRITRPKGYYVETVSCFLEAGKMATGIDSSGANDRQISPSNSFSYDS